MTPRIILPADTTVTVGDTLWWGVKGCTGQCSPLTGAYFHTPACVGVPPEWQALTEACATCGGTGTVGNSYGDCGDCHEGRRTVELQRGCAHCHDTGDTTDGRPCWKCAGKGYIPLGRAVIDGDWVRMVEIPNLGPRSEPLTITCVSVNDGDALHWWHHDAGRRRITLHGHTDPGGYAARFEVIA